VTKRGEKKEKLDELQQIIHQWQKIIENNLSTKPTWYKQTPTSRHQNANFKKIKKGKGESAKVRQMADTPKCEQHARS